MFIPDVLNTLLLGLILLVIVVTVVRPIMLNLVFAPGQEEQVRRQVEHSVQEHLALQFEKAAAERVAHAHFQRLLLDVPPSLARPAAADSPWLPEEEPVAQADGAATEGADASASSTPGAEGEGTPPLAEGEIEIREGESLAEIKERLKREQQQAKKPTIPPELLQGANSYEDKVGVVRMVGQNDQARVASLIRNMVQADLG